MYKSEWIIIILLFFASAGSGVGVQNDESADLKDGQSCPRASEDALAWLQQADHSGHLARISAQAGLSSAESGEASVLSDAELCRELNQIYDRYRRARVRSEETGEYHAQYDVSYLIYDGLVIVHVWRALAPRQHRLDGAPLFATYHDSNLDIIRTAGDVPDDVQAHIDEDKLIERP